MSPVVLLIIAIHIFIVRLMTKKERQEIRLPQNKKLWIQCKKAALGFKIATVLFGAAHYLFLLPFFIKQEDDIWAAIIFLMILALTTIIFASSLSSIYCYNFLFFVNSEKATQILLVPVTLAILINFIFSPLFTITINIVNILSLIIIPCTIIFYIIIMRVLLSKKRKRFYAKQID